MQLVGNDFDRGRSTTLWMTFISKGDLNVFSLCRFCHLNSVTEPRLSTSWRSTFTSMFIRTTFHFLEPLSMRHLRWSDLYCGSYTWPYSSFSPGDSWAYNLAKDWFPPRGDSNSHWITTHEHTLPSASWHAYQRGIYLPQLLWGQNLLCKLLIIMTTSLCWYKNLSYLYQLQLDYIDINSTCSSVVSSFSHSWGVKGQQSLNCFSGVELQDSSE